MEYKLIALDIDGTLLNSSHQITENVKEAIKKSKEKGVKVVLCTGRPLKGVEDFLEELNLKEEGDYVTTFNGALVQDAFTGEAISHLTLDYQDLCDLYNLSLEVGSRSHFYDTKTVYTFNKGFHLVLRQECLMGCKKIICKFSVTGFPLPVFFHYFSFT